VVEKEILVYFDTEPINGIHCLDPDGNVPYAFDFWSQPKTELL
jgi:hypothetical protein